MEANFQQLHQPINYSNPINPGQFQASNQTSNGVNLINLNNIVKNDNGASMQQQPQTSAQRNNSIGNHNDNVIMNQNFKFPPQQQQNNQYQNGNPTSTNGRPMSRGDLQTNRIQQHQMQNAFAISNDQQTFQLPANTNNSGNMQPQFHFIANQQKFYAQISPDKAPMLFSDKRPFTQGTQANNGGNQQNERANSNNHSNSKTGRAKNQQNQNPMPYIQIASKTHTGSFPLAQMQIGPQGTKYISSASQLDQNQNNHLVSIFSQNSTNVNMNPQTSATLQNILNQNNNNHLKVSKIKPNKNNIKEKEQLYEDAIKLKIQSNNYREENIKLKTKIKILENEMQKKEKAMEDFIQKMSINQPTAHQASMFYSPMTNSKHQVQPSMAVGGQSSGLGSGSGSIGGQPTIIPMNNNFMASTSQKMQSESFLVMSLKKQLKDQRIETLKREEELDLLKKNIKTTQKSENEAEIKAYQDELQRMRFLMEELMREGPNHPIYQKQALDKIQMLEQSRQQQDYLIKQLQQDNTDLANLVKQRDEELQKKKDEKEKKTEMKNELAKLKKSVRDKDKDLLKLRTELSSLKKVSQLTAQSTENSSNLAGPNISNNKVEEKKDQNTVLENQVKQLQKKLKDAQTDIKSKKDKMDEQDVVIKKLQERLQQKLDELASEQKKIKNLQDELSTYKKEKEDKDKHEQKIKSITQTYQKDIEVLIIECKHEEVNYEELINNLEKNRSLFSNKLYDAVKDLEKEVIKQIIPIYSLISEKQKQELESYVKEKVAKCKTSLKEACELEQNDYSSSFITFEQFEDALQSIELNFSEEILEYLKVKYYERIGDSQIGFAFKKLFEDQKQQKQKNNVKVLESQVPGAKEEKQKRSRPTTAKSNNSQSQLNQKSQHSLKQIKEDEEQDDEDEDYEEDFEETKKEDNKKTSDISKSSIRSKKNGKKDESDKEPTKPDIKKSNNNTAEIDHQELSSAKKKKRSRSNDQNEKKDTEGDSENAEVQRYMEEEEMLDIAEHCFIRVAEMLLERNKTARAIFTKYSVPEQFPDGTILELMSPIAFLEGVKEAGMEELSEMEAACLLRVLAKPELDNAIILNEFIMIMENFGVMDAYEDDDDEDDYIKSEDETDGGDQSKSKINEIGPQDEKKEGEEKDNEKKPDQFKPRKKKKIQINFDLLEEKGLKILQKLARFLLERYLHPREFFGPAIYKQLVKTKKRENNVDILQTKDFYLRLKIAGIRKTVKEIDNLNKFLCLDQKFPQLMQVKRVIKALEEVAQGEQLKLQEEMMRKQEEMIKNSELEGSPGKEKLETEEDEGDIGEDEKKMKKALAAARMEDKKKFGNNQDLLREAGLGSMGMPPASLTGGPSGYGGGGYDYGMMRGAPPSKIAMLMGFNHLNTIEEEKHETQNSNYFRDMESERDESKYHNNSNFLAKGSRILDDEQLYDQNSSNKPSPYQQKKKENEDEEDEENYEEHHEDEYEDQEKKEGDEDDNHEYEEDEDDEIDQKHSDRPNFQQSNNQLRNISTLRDEENKDASQRIDTDNMDKSIKDMKSVQSHDDDVDDYASGDNNQFQEEEIQNEVNEKKQRLNKNSIENPDDQEHEYEEESDYEI